MEIQRMTVNDVDDVAELDKLCFTVPWSRQAFADEMENKIAVYFTAKDNGKVIGYCGFWQAADEADITNIAVLPQFRKQGVGGELLKSLIKKADEMGLVQINLEVRKSNEPAKRLYEKYGFEPIGERKRYYRDNNEDAVIMSKYIGKENK